MPISTDEAGRALADADAARDRAQRWYRFKGPDLLYMIWGAVWVIGFTSQQFLPATQLRFGNFTTPLNALPWSILTPPAILATFLVIKYGLVVTGPEGKRIGIFWGLLYGYFYLWMFLLHPLFFNVNQFYSSPNAIAVVTTIPMFAYVVMGLWGCGNYMIWLGLSVTVLTVIGLLFVTAWFYLWMALFGGGALFLAGILARRQWRKA
jgi:hypothetical protein